MSKYSPELEPTPPPQAWDQRLEHPSVQPSNSCQASGMNVIFIDPNLHQATHLQYLLDQACDLLDFCQVEHYPSLEAAQARLSNPTPPILLILILPLKDPQVIINQLDTIASRIPLILISPPEHEALGLALLHFGAQDYLVNNELSPRILARSIHYAQERHRTKQALWQKAEQERLVIQITQNIHASLDLETILDTTVQEIRQFLKADRVAIYRFRPNYSGTMVNEAVIAPWPSVLGDVIHDHCFSQNFVDQYQNGRIQALGNIHTAKLHPCHKELLQYYDVQANLVVPIVVAGKLWGLIITHQCSQPREWAAEEVNLVRQLSTQVAIAIYQAELYSQLQAELNERQELENRLRHQAQHDSLTGLPNRDLLSLRLQETIERPDNAYAILCLDLDRFKTINDSLGHSVGDVFLQEIAQRLKRAVSPQDFVARMAGDEFVIILDQLRDQAQAETIAQHLIDRLAIPFKANQYNLHTTATLGLVMGTPDYQKPEELLRDADTAMYRAKGLGKNRYEVFNSQLYLQVSQRLNLELEMWQAVERGEFTLVYQPIFNLNTKKLVGLETLIRWPHPTKGMISPADFIPIAEETGLIIPLGTWVLQTACQQFHLWRQSYPYEFTEDIGLSINLSGKQFSQATLVEQISNILKANKVPGSCLKVEITESTLMEHLQSAQQMLHELKGLGIETVIDDFGTGYSSLSYLSHLPLDRIKIDRSFITCMEQTPENLEVVHAVISLAQILKLDVVAEGIETDSQLATLKTLGCPHGQGYWYSPPLPPELVPVFLREHS